MFERKAGHLEPFAGKQFKQQSEERVVLADSRFSKIHEL